MKVNQKLTDMIKRISHLVLFYAFLLGATIFVQSCCQGIVKIVGNGTMEILNSGLNGEGDITGPFIVYAYPEAVLSDVTRVGLMNSAYATSCDYAYDNNIMPESVTLTCAKSFEFKDMTIESGTDLLKLDGVEAPIFFNSSQDPSTVIVFTETFIDQAVFEESEYTFTINMSTDDGLDIVNSASAVFRL